MKQSSKKSAMIRISLDARNTLSKLSEETGLSMQSLIAQAIESYRRSYFFEQLDLGYAKLKEDKKSASAFQKEQAQWESTLSDGLD